MPCLLEVQRSFRDAVLAGDRAPVPAEVVGGTVGAAARLAAYRNNVIGNLTRALQISYPAIQRLVGEEFFAVAAQHFIVASLPNVADLNKYGDGFADFLTSFEASAGVPYLADVARLEWAVNRAFHAPAVPPLDPQALRRVPAERQADLRFVVHPTLSLLRASYPARAIWEAVLTADADERAARLAGIDLESGGETLAVLRRDEAPDVTALAEDAFELAQALIGGQTLGDALEHVVPEIAAALLADFLTRGFFADVYLPEQRPPTTESKSP